VPKAWLFLHPVGKLLFREGEAMKILVTGANGQLGKTIGRCFMEDDLVLTDINSLDITKETVVFEAIQVIKPDVIINCAAYTDVDKCEKNQSQAYEVNARGVHNLALGASKIGCELVHISTDYVFDGKGIVENGKRRPYQEMDQVNPKTIYGKTKLLGEQFLQETIENYYLIRTAWLYGDGFNFIKRILMQGYSNETVSVVTDQIGTPTSTDQLARLIKVLLKEKSYGSYHGSCEGSCTRYEYARAIFDRMGINKSIEPITSKDLKQLARRPSYSVLENKRLNEKGIFKFNHWEEALVEYLEELKTL